ncbi:MarC family protein [Breznakiella homolactica]|uniref:UPF0056 membrane protein n=1 Tax=Breznakiella homolactica TaxID=2798577 RepID=A0A7T7XNE6_9SPIR|nr:MarC family protein [Breznakiella homolactica]QQO09555.1 MarC family protein [Breznakiella homolactica]
MLATFLPIFFTMFIVIDPIGLVPMYLGLTSHTDPALKGQIIRKALLSAFLVLGLFIIAGKWILGLLHIEAGSFFIAGGIMLFIVSLEMLFGRPSRTKVSRKEMPQETQREEDGEEGASVAIFPLAIPMMAGPGAITTIILFTSSEHEPVSMMVMLFVCLIIILTITGIAFKASDIILKYLGKTGVSVIERIMGLLLSGLSVQFVYDGMVKLGIVGGMLG